MLGYPHTIGSMQLRPNLPRQLPWLLALFVSSIHLVGSLQTNLHPHGPTLAGLAVSRRVDINPSSGDDFFRNKLISSCCAAFFCARGSHLCDLPPQHAQV